MPAAFKVKGPLDDSALERALNEIVHRHETFANHLPYGE